MNNTIIKWVVNCDLCLKEYPAGFPIKWHYYTALPFEDNQLEWEGHAFCSERCKGNHNLGMTKTEIDLIIDSFFDEVDKIDG